MQMTCIGGFLGVEFHSFDGGRILQQKGIDLFYTIPDYYKAFKCTADRCDDTCCAGWQIAIDQRSLIKYKKITGRFRFRMWMSVDWFHGRFRQDQEKRCAFLNRENLCDLYIDQGENSLCKTCRMYPRHVEEFENLREISLSISCPEAARMIMERKEPVTFKKYEKPGTESFEDFNSELFQALVCTRNKVFQVLQERSMPVRQRVSRILKCRLTFKDEVLFGRELFFTLFKLETVREEWGELLWETEQILYGDGIKAYVRRRKAYERWHQAHPDMEIHLEQLLVYFIFIYMLGAVYDGQTEAKLWMAVSFVWMIEQLWMARWAENDGDISIEEMTELVYRFSREVEHSDINLEIIENMLNKRIKKWREVHYAAKRSNDTAQLH